MYANGDLWRTNVVHVLGERADPDDALYFLHDGSAPIVARPEVTGQAAPFVPEAAPVDRDWNGGQSTTYSAEVTDVDAFAADAPLSSATASSRQTTST